MPGERDPQRAQHEGGRDQARTLPERAGDGRHDREGGVCSLSCPGTRLRGECVVCVLFVAVISLLRCLL